MSMVCPQCNGTFEQRLRCPACDVRLLYQAPHGGRDDGLPGPPGQWQHTPWGRIFVGLLLAQGLYHGLRQFCTAGWLAVAESSQEVWSTLFGLMLQQGLQAFGVLAGAILAGAGQRRGLLLGVVLGVWDGLILIALEQFRPRSFAAAADALALPLTSVTAYGQPLLLAAVGAVGGLIGCLVWRPLPALDLPGLRAPRVPALRLGSRDAPSLFAGPVAWGRILVGIAVAVGGAIWANVILDFVLMASEGALAISSHLQARLVTLEICALAVVLGGAWAGATRANGLKQGLSVGLGAAAVLVGIQLGRAAVPVNQLVFTAASTTFLALAGGWFGGQLFPPVYGPPRYKVSTINSL